MVGIADASDCEVDKLLVDWSQFIFLYNKTNI